MMRKTALLMAAILTVFAFTACGTKNSDSKTDGSQIPEAATGETISEGVEDGNAGKDELPKANKMMEQGNPLTVKLSDIAEAGGDDFKAWIKISTAFDPELSMYQSDMIPEKTAGIVVDFTVDGMDIDKTEMYWCYQITSGGESISLWDNTSAADKLTVDGDGSYRLVFDAGKALGGTIDLVESLQMVFPGISETTSTTVTVDYAGHIDQSMDMADFVTGKIQ